MLTTVKNAMNLALPVIILVIVPTIIPNTFNTININANMIKASNILD